MEFHRWASIENLELELEKETEDVKNWLEIASGKRNLM